MKTLKLDHESAAEMLRGEKTSTWRVFDDQDISAGDEVIVIDQVDAGRPGTWRRVGTVKVINVVVKVAKDLSEAELLTQNYIDIDDMITTLRRHYDSKVTSTTPVKIIDFIFNRGKLQSETHTTTPRSSGKVRIYADGGSRGNPGPSAAGYVVKDATTDEVLAKRGEYIGVTTNNQAEYLAVKFALAEARRLGANEADVYLDSMLVVNQMKGIFKVKNRDLWPVHTALTELVNSFRKVSFSHIPREQNGMADACVNQALDEHAGSVADAKDGLASSSPEAR